MKRLLVMVMVLVPVLVFGQVIGTVSHKPMSRGELVTTGVVTLTRDSSTTAYAANDMVANSATASKTYFWRLPTGRESGYITNMSLFVDTAETGAFRFWIFADTIASDTTTFARIADNAVFTILGPDTDHVNFIGYVDINVYTEGTGSTGSFGQTDGIGMSFATNYRSLWGLLETKAAYTPKQIGKFRLKYRLLQ